MRNFLIIITVCAAALFSSCCKEGLNGKATVTATAKHHSTIVPGCTVYIKFDAKDAPASLSDYDVSYTADAASGNVVIENLKCGDYYFFATGYDPSIMEQVQGGVPFSIAHADRKNELVIDIPVSEGH
jgi:FlaG/FlaF family flagellin (archaellin)